MVKDVEQNIDVFENDVDKYLQLFCEEQGIDDLRAMPQNVWTAALMYVGKNVFKGSKMLKRTTPPEKYAKSKHIEKHPELYNSNCNAYDLNILNNVCDIYIYMCMMYDKIPNQQGFVYLTGMSVDTVCRWKKDSDILSQGGSELFEKLYNAEEEALTSKAFSLRNPTGALAALNHKKGWREDGKLHVQQVEQKTAAELPRLDTVTQHVVTVEDKTNKI